MSDDKKKVLFVCFANTCRSPIAEGVFQKVLNDLGLGDQWEVESASTGDFQVGKPPNWRSLLTMSTYGVPYKKNKRARQIVADDFNYYDYIIGMDDANMRDLQDRAPSNCKATLLRLGDFDPMGESNIRDPYFDSDDRGFLKCYQQTLRSSKGFLEHLRKQKKVL